MQTQTLNSFEEFHFKIPNQRQDIIKAFKVTNEPKQTNQSLREQMRGDFFRHSGAFANIFTNINADDLQNKKVLS